MKESNLNSIPASDLHANDFVRVLLQDSPKKMAVSDFARAINPFLTISGGAGSLNNLVDVDLTNVNVSDVLIYNGIDWVNGKVTYNDLLNKPTLSTVATSGDYNDLLNLPSIPQTTNDLPEGTNNLYYTDTRARNALSATGDLSYNSTTGEFSVTTYKTSDFNTDFATKDTDDLSEGVLNLYYTDARVNADIDTRVDKAFVDALNVNADTLDNQDGTYYLDYNNFTNTPAIPSVIDDLSDVVITTPTTDEILKYNGSEWVNDNVGYGSLTTDLQATQLTFNGGVPEANGSALFTSNTGSNIAVNNDGSVYTYLYYSNHYTLDATPDIIYEYDNSGLNIRSYNIATSSVGINVALANNISKDTFAATKAIDGWATATQYFIYVNTNKQLIIRNTTLERYKNAFIVGDFTTIHSVRYVDNTIFVHGLLSGAQVFRAIKISGTETNPVLETLYTTNNVIQVPDFKAISRNRIVIIVPSINYGGYVMDLSEGNYTNVYYDTSITSATNLGYSQKFKMYWYTYSTANGYKLAIRDLRLVDDATNDSLKSSDHEVVTTDTFDLKVTQNRNDFYYILTNAQTDLYKYDLEHTDLWTDQFIYVNDYKVVTEDDYDFVEIAGYGDRITTNESDIADKLDRVDNKIESTETFANGEPAGYVPFSGIINGTTVNFTTDTVGQITYGLAVALEQDMAFDINAANIPGIIASTTNNKLIITSTLNEPLTIQNDTPDANGDPFAGPSSVSGLSLTTKAPEPYINLLQSDIYNLTSDLNNKLDVTATVGDLSDVDTTGVADGDILIYNSSAGAFEVGPVPSSGGAEIGDITYTANTPAGYLECDGSVYLQSAYPTLYSKLGLIINGLRREDRIAAAPSISGTPRGCDITSDSRYIFIGTGTAGQSVIRIDTNDWSFVNVDASLPSLTVSISVAPDDSYVIVCANGGDYFYKYDVTTLARDTSFTNPVSSLPFMVDHRPDGTEIALAMGSGNTILVLDSSDMSIKYNLSSEFDGQVYACAYSNDSTMLTTCAGLASWFDGPVIFETTTYTDIYRTDKTFFSANCFAITFSKNDRYIAYAAQETSTSGTLAILDTSTELYFSVDHFTGAVRSVDFNSNGEILAVGDTDDGLTLLDTHTWDTIPPTPIISKNNGPWVSKFAPDGSYLAGGSAAGTNRLYVFDSYTYDTSSEFAIPLITLDNPHNRGVIKPYIKHD